MIKGRGTSECTVHGWPQLLWLTCCSRQITPKLSALQRDICLRYEVALKPCLSALSTVFYFKDVWRSPVSCTSWSCSGHVCCRPAFEKLLIVCLLHVLHLSISKPIQNNIWGLTYRYSLWYIHILSATHLSNRPENHLTNEVHIIAMK